MRGGSWSNSLLLAAMVCGLCGPCGQGRAFGQELHLKSRDIYTGPAPPSPLARSRREPTVLSPRLGPVHRIIQFDHLPGTEDLDALLAAGFRVVGAIPDNAVVVIAATSLPAPTIGVRWVGELEPGDKLSSNLDPTLTPISAIVEFHADVDANTQEAVMAAEALSFARPPVLLTNHVIVSAPMSGLRALAAHDEVAYIFPADPALLLANTAGSTLMPCAGMLTLAGPIAQYANIVHGWDLEGSHAAYLGYAFGTLTSKVPATTVESEILRALNAWSAITNVVFQPAPDISAARTVLFKFASGAHGDAYPFDGPGGILAHTFYPVPVNSESIAGDVHLDADENWHAGGDIDIYSVALHEIGHAIGLAHTDNPGDVMYPYYRRGMQLSKNDIGAAQALYGLPVSVMSAAPVTASPALLSLSLNPILPPGAASQIAIGGAVSGGVPPIALQFQTDQGYSGKITQAPSGAFNASGVTLVTGTNTITVTAFDSANKTASQSAVVTRSAASASAGATPVSILITSPSSAVTTAKGTTVSLGGTSSGGAGITRVAWQTAAGAVGVATGTAPWLASNIPLLVGTNTIVVRAFDSKGVSAWASVVVVRSQ